MDAVASSFEQLQEVFIKAGHQPAKVRIEIPSFDVVPEIVVNSTGAEIVADVPDDESLPLAVIVSGTVDCVQYAKRAIEGIIGGKTPEVALQQAHAQLKHMGIVTPILAGHRGRKT